VTIEVTERMVGGHPWVLFPVYKMIRIPSRTILSPRLSENLQVDVLIDRYFRRHMIHRGETTSASGWLSDPTRVQDSPNARAPRAILTFSADTSTVPYALRYVCHQVRIEERTCQL